MLQNSKFEGAVSGTPGTAPTNWTAGLTGGTMTVAPLVVGNSLAFSTTAARHYHTQTFNVLANTTYRIDVSAIMDGVQNIWNCLFPASPPAGTTTNYELDGTVVAGNAVPAAGSHIISAIAVVAGTAGTISLRLGLGAQGNATGTITISKPHLVASPYQMPYAASGTGATVSVPQTSGAADGTGLAIPIDARVAAAMGAGGKFTVSAMVEMGVSSAQVTAPANILSVNDVAAGLIFADSGGKLKCTDGTNTAEVTVGGGWVRTDDLLPVVQCNGATFRIGYAKNTFAAITWGSAVAVGADGDWNVVTHERFGLDSTIVFGAQQAQTWGKVASEAEVLKVRGYAV